MSDKHDAFVAWMDKAGAREVPITSLLPGRTIPLWARPTIQEPVETMHSVWTRLRNILDDIRANTDDDDPFYEPTADLINLMTLERDLRGQAFRTVPNPEYDAERAKTHWTHQTQFVAGQSYNPEVPTDG